MHFAQIAECRPQEVCLFLNDLGLVYRLPGGRLRLNYPQVSFLHSAQAILKPSDVKITEGATEEVVARTNISAVTFKILNEYYSRRGGTVELIEISEDFLEMTARSLKGEIDAPFVWLKLHLAIFFSGTGLRLILDGFAASGLGNAPPDDAYMPVGRAYHGALTHYARRLATSIARTLQKPGAPLRLL